MRGILKKWGLHSPDEIERAICLRAQRNAYIFLLIALLAWALYEGCRVYAHGGGLNPIPAALLVTTASIQTLSRLVMARSAVKDDEDSWETGPLVKIILAVCVIFGLLTASAAAIVLMGVQI